MSLILVVEDRPEDMAGIIEAVRRRISGLTIEEAMSVQSFWDAFNKGKPDLILLDLVLLDLMLPQTDESSDIDIDAGLRILKELEEKGFTTPVIILTARLGTEPWRQNVDKMVIVKETLFKPVDADQLAAAIRKYLGGGRMRAGK